jgi:hypothetical protein
VAVAMRWPFLIGSPPSGSRRRAACLRSHAAVSAELLRSALFSSASTRLGAEVLALQCSGRGGQVMVDVMVMIFLSPRTTRFFAFRREKSIATGRAAVQRRKEATMTGRNGRKTIKKTAPRSDSALAELQGGRAGIPLWSKRAAAAPLASVAVPRQGISSQRVA